MTAIRVVTDHQELDNSGLVSHSDIDTYITGSTFLVVSGSGPLPPSGRRLVAGIGITIVDGGPGGNLVISAPGSQGQSISWMEIPGGQADGITMDFNLINQPNPGSALMFFINGVLQRQGADSDYLLVSGSIVHILHPYRSGSNLTATYPY
jgi:hypothetical protein